MNKANGMVGVGMALALAGGVAYGAPGGSRAASVGRTTVWARATAPGPVFSKRHSDFTRTAKPRPGGRGVWVLDGAAVDTTCGYKDTASLVCRHPTPRTSRAWVHLPPYDELDDYVYPEYDVTLRAKWQDVAPGARLWVRLDGRDVGVKAQTRSRALAGQSDWTCLTFRVTGSRTLFVGVLAIGFEGTGTVWVDDVKLVWPYRSADYMPPGTAQVALLYSGWTWRTDPEGHGMKQRWFDPAYHAKGWAPVSVTKWLPIKGGRVTAWERAEVTVPAELKGRRVFLRFGAVDFDATVWVNGQYVTRHSGWLDPFVGEITRVMRPGAKNLIVVRVENPVQAPGGIYKGVTLHATK